MESIRFSGLASGMDTQSIVDSMMKAERVPLDRLNQRKQILEWQRDDYRGMNKLLDDFDKFLFDNIYRQSKMLKRTTTSSNSDFVSATASASAGNVSYKIENVTLATAARRQSFGDTNTKVSGTTKIDSAKSLWSQRKYFRDYDSVTGTDPIPWKQEDIIKDFTVTSGGSKEFQLPKGATSNLPSQITVSGHPNSPFTVREDIDLQTQTLGANEVYINTSTGKMIFGTALQENQTFSVSYKHNYLEFDIKTFDEGGNAKYKHFKIDGTSSLNNMFSTINNSDAGVNLFYDSFSDKVVAMRTDTGDFNPSGVEMEFVNVTRDANGVVTENTGANRLNQFFNDVLGLTNETGGTNAKFKINGLETERKSNMFTMNDVTFTLKKASTTDSATINVKTDTEEIFKTIKEFVDKYNEMIEKINGELNEERFRTFLPLTEEQKLAMKEKEIEKWEEKAKSGMLRRDTLLSTGLSKFRMDLYSEVKSTPETSTDPKYNQLAEIGIKTTKNYLERGKLEIDENKLKAAIEDNPEAIYQLFMADGPSQNGNTSQVGIARRLRASISETMGKIEAKAGNVLKVEHNYSMGKELIRIKEDITRFEDRLKLKEKRYWNQFNAMEKAMQKLNDQSSQLLAQLGLNQQK